MALTTDAGATRVVLHEEQDPLATTPRRNMVQRRQYENTPLTAQPKVGGQRAESQDKALSFFMLIVLLSPVRYEAQKLKKYGKVMMLCHAHFMLSYCLGLRMSFFGA